MKPTDALTTQNELNQAKEDVTTSKHEFEHDLGLLKFNFNILKALYKKSADKLSPSDKVMFDNMSKSKTAEVTFTSAASSTAVGTPEAIMNLKTINNGALSDQVFYLI